MPDKAAMGKAAAAAGAEHIRHALKTRGVANIIVATGASQFEMLAELVKEPHINWNRVTGFHLDEYVGLPIDHPASFRGYLWERFVSQLPLPLRAFHYLNAEENPQAECQRVGDILRQHPVDVAFVGIGENGHLAFNDPPADFATEEPYLVVQLDDACRRQQLGEGWFPTLDDVPKQAISMSVRQIMNSAAIICTVPDERKAQAVKGAIEGAVSPQVPASILQQHRQCTLFLDPPAALQLRP
ncbi:MAG: glucosamine-6-phosphate deaminase [Pirellulales bacterium]